MKVGLLTSTSLSEFRMKTMIPILNDDRLSVKVAVIDTRPKKTVKEKIIKNIKRGRGGYIVIMAIKKLFAKSESGLRTEDFCNEHAIDTIKTNNPYAPDIINRIRQFNLDVLLLIGGFGIIKEPLLSITPIGILSYHHGDMRKYRGMPPGFWELYYGEKEMGITVQILSKRLDAGKPVMERSIGIYNSDSVQKLRRRAQIESINMMHSALIKLTDEYFIPPQLKELGKVYSLPNLTQWIQLHMRLLMRRFAHKK